MRFSLEHSSLRRREEKNSSCCCSLYQKYIDKAIEKQTIFVLNWLRMVFTLARKCNIRFESISTVLLLLLSLCSKANFSLKTHFIWWSANFHYTCLCAMGKVFCCLIKGLKHNITNNTTSNTLSFAYKLIRF